MAKLGPTTVYGSIDVTGIASLKDVNLNTINGAVVGTSDYVGGGVNDTFDGSVEVIPVIQTNGVMEVGRYIDFHVNGSTADYNARIDMSSTNNLDLIGAGLRVFDYDIEIRGTNPFLKLISSDGAIDSTVEFYSATGQNAALRHEIADSQLPISGQALILEDISTAEGTHPVHLIVDGRVYVNNTSRVFADDYHPNADKWTNSRTLSLTGDATGSVSWDGSSNASITVVVANDSHTHDSRYYTEAESDALFAPINGAGYVDKSGDTMTGNLTVDAGVNSTITVACDDAGVALFQALGTNQGTGRFYVGQSSSHGGGIEYNGDGTPTGSGSGSDYITLYRRSSGTDYWTARNNQSDNNWEFRGTVTAPTFSGALSGNASTATWADTVDVNSGNTSATWYDVVWHSSDSLYSSQSSKAVEIQSSTGSLRAFGEIQAARFVLGGDTSRYMKYGTEEGSWIFHSDNGVEWEFGSRNTTWLHNTTTASNGFYYYNNIQSTGNITAYSDVRVKDDIRVIENALDKVGQLGGYTYERTDVVTPRQTGVIAQEVQKVLPEAVMECAAEDGHLAVAYGNMVGLLIEAIKEERAERESLEDRIERLEALLD